MDSQRTLYGHHSDNLRSVAQGFDQTLTLLEHKLAEGQLWAADSLTRLCVLLLGAKSEARLAKLLFEPPVPEEFRDKVRADKPSIYEMWRRTVKFAFREYYDTTGDFGASSAPASARQNYVVLLGAVQQLRPIAELRNSVAHGQWQHTLTSRGTGRNDAKTRDLRSENAMTLRLRDEIAGATADAVNDLVVSRGTLQRDIARSVARIEEAQRSLAHRSWEKYLANLQRRALRSRNARRAAVGKPPIQSDQNASERS